VTDEEKDKALRNHQAYNQGNPFKSLEDWMATTVPPGRGAEARFTEAEREEIRAYSRKMGFRRHA
jgi:hypothetical protein